MIVRRLCSKNQDEAVNMDNREILRYLAELGFGPGDNPTVPEVKKRWKDLCRKHHPDAGGDPAQFQQVTHAYKMITDPDYREKHVLEQMRSGKANEKGDLNLRIQIPISFEDAFFGRKITLSWNQLEFDDNLEPSVGDPIKLRTETVRIPPGSIPGHEHMVRDGGHRKGESSGRAYLLFQAQPHKRFKVDSIDVISTEQIPLSICLKGGKVEVPTMYGVKAVAVPPGTKPDDKLTVPRCGVKGRGNHIVVVDPLYPNKDDLQKDEWKGLEIDWGAGNESPDDEAEDYIRQFLDMTGTPYDGN